MSNYKLFILILLIFLFSVIKVFSQSTFCFPAINYKESYFQIEQINDNTYKTVLTILGTYYLNPCIYKIQEENNKINVYCKLETDETHNKIEILLLIQKRNFFNKIKKYKTFKVVKQIGVFESNSEIVFELESLKTFTVLFTNLSKEKESTAIQISRID
jgi:hypothetical protein